MHTGLPCTAPQRLFLTAVRASCTARQSLGSLQSRPLEPVLSAFHCQREGLSGRHLSLEVLTDVCLGGQLLRTSAIASIEADEMHPRAGHDHLSSDKPPHARGTRPRVSSLPISPHRCVLGTSGMPLLALAIRCLLGVSYGVLAGISASSATQASPGAACSPDLGLGARCRDIAWRVRFPALLPPHVRRPLPGVS